MFLSVESEFNDSMTEDLVLKVHNLVVGKSLTFKNNYRKSQNVVADSISGNIVYMPPEAKDVSILMKQIIREFNSSKFKDIPIPIRAVIFAYEIVTIHPFMEPNGNRYLFYL